MERIAKTLAAVLMIGLPLASYAQDEQSNSQKLDTRIQALEQELAKLKAERGQIKAAEDKPVTEGDITVVQDQPEQKSGDIIIHDNIGGSLKVGGAIRANYVIGDYNTGSGPGRGGNGGNFELDTFRINLDYTNGPWSGKAEYRFYDGYNFIHTLYAGYTFEDDSILKVGLNRAPFGVGAYGPANSWFFDQHYYVGLSDDMDLGACYTKSIGEWTIDIAAYVAPEWNGNGNTKDSTRYSYDIVDTGAVNAHYTEQGQLNLRVVRSFKGAIPTDVGGSLQIGRLAADKRYADDTVGYAASVHTKSSLGNWGLMTQLTRYDYNPDYNGSDGSDNNLIAMGAYDWAAPVASKAWIPSIAVNYLWTPKDISWIDSINFYNDYSVIVKDSGDGEDFNDSAMNVLGMAIAHGGWYIYVDYAYSNGNYFVGDKGDFGANLNDEWQGRFNVNFGYYF